MELKRDLVKYVRDRAKSRYRKMPVCYICGSDVRLDFHHFYSLTPLLQKWMRETRVDPEKVLEWRDTFIEEHKYELYKAAVTICHGHHEQLHSIYGKNPSLATATKQIRWVEIQREKHGMV